MGVLDGLFGRKKPAGPVCARCGKPIQASPRSMGGLIMYEGTQCAACGRAYCLYCHNFGSLGPKCPGCSEWQLGPLVRSA
jgi:hypothetical protein